MCAYFVMSRVWIDKLYNRRTFKDAWPWAVNVPKRTVRFIDIGHTRVFVDSATTHKIAS